MGGITTSMGAVTQFQKNRLIITSPSLQSPNQTALYNIIKTFAGQDQQTRSQVAFATIIKKIHTSQSNQSWIYLLRNLIIFDKVVTQKYFIQQISALDMPKISSYIEKDKKNLQIDTNKIVRDYWKLIQKKATIYKSKKNVICYNRSLRYDFLSSLNFQQVLKQIYTLQQLSVLCFNLSSDIVPVKSLDSALYLAKKQLQDSELISYLNLQILYQLMICYSCELLSIKRMVSIMASASNSNILLESISQKKIKEFQLVIQRFKNIAKQIINFAERYKDKKGFQVINYRQLDPFKQYDLFKIIENFKVQRKKIQQFEPFIENLVISQQRKLIIQKIPELTQIIQKKNQNRLDMDLKQNKINKQKNFFNYINSYSDEFPPNQVLTVHLMMMLKKQKQENIIIEDPVIYGSRQSCIYNYTEIPKIENLLYQKPKYLQNKNQLHKFKNIFSELTKQWVST